MPPFSTLVGALDAYWYAIAAIITFLVAVWKLVPVERRDAFERRFPRFVGLVRLAIALLPDLVTAGRALRIQIIEGAPKRGPQPEVFRDPPQRSGFIDRRVLHALALLAVLTIGPQLLGCAGAQHGDTTTQLVAGYGIVRTWGQRICGIVAMLPPPPTPSAPLDGGVP